MASLPPVKCDVGARLAVIEPFYPKGERGRPPVGLERMLRVYFLQQWYGLADEALEDALYDSQALHGFTALIWPPRAWIARRSRDGNGAVVTSG